MQCIPFARPKENASHCASIRPSNNLNQSVVKRQGTDDSFVPFAAFFELLDVEAAILILVHHPEDLPYALLRGIFVLREFHHGSNLYSS